MDHDSSSASSEFKHQLVKQFLDVDASSTNRRFIDHRQDFLGDHFGRWQHPQSGANSSYQAFQRAIDKPQKISNAEVENLGGVFGDPEYFTERVQALRDEFNMNEFICYFNQGGLVDHAAVKRLMELFAREIIPQFQ